MCNLLDPTVASVVDTVIQEKIDAGDPFTAYSITQEVRKRGHRAYHNDVKPAVHEPYLNGTYSAKDYTRTLIHTPTGDAYLYHKVGYDVQSYADNLNGTQQPSSPAVATPAGPATVASLSVVQPSNAVTKTVDVQGRLRLSPSLVKSIGGTRLGTVAVYAVGPNLEVSVPSYNSATPYCTYTVNKNGRVRISRNVLGWLKNLGSTYKVELTTDSNGNPCIRISRP
jgi:hypothetical protein